MRIGVDFDNTIAGYDRLFAGLAVEARLFDEPPPGGKRGLRDELRRCPGGEVAWQKLQASAYGPRMIEAELMPGAARFLRACRQRGDAVFIVSHKTRYAARGGEGCDLRAAALAWMEAQGFFEDEGFGLEPGCVFFEGTRGEKLGRIARLRVSHFIDDLEELFAEPGFPEGIEAILYAPHGAPAPAAGPGPARYAAFAGWDQITEHLLGAPA